MRLLLCLSIFSSLVVFAKNIEIDSFLVAKEQQVSVILKNLRDAGEDVAKEMYNIELQAELEKLLEYPGVLDYPFNKWTSMSTIKSPDGEFRIFNWNIESQSLTHSHFCYLVKSGKGKTNYVYKFTEDNITIPPRPSTTLTPDHWYGALYYKIIPVHKGNKTFYTMLGYSGEDRSTNQKLIDVFYFKGKGLRMGYPMFQEAKDSKKLVQRVFFQYSEKAVISVNLNDKIGGIVFDHLVPEQKNLEGMFDFYIPDMTYDCYRWDGGIWQYHEDVIAYNDPNKKIKQWHPTNDGDSSEYDEMKDFWINPVDPNSPVNSGTDATAPIEDVRTKKSRKDSRKEAKAGRRKFKLFKKKSKNRSAIGADQLNFSR